MIERRIRLLALCPHDVPPLRASTPPCAPRRELRSHPRLGCDAHRRRHIAYTFGEDWSLVDGFYFAVATLTTSSIADPDLVITNSWLKVFTIFYILIGIGILVEVARQLGVALIHVQREDHEAKAAAKAAKTQPTAADRRPTLAAQAPPRGRCSAARRKP